MTVSNSAIKATAKKIIKPSYVKNVVVSIVLIMLWFFCYNLSAVLSLIMGNLAFYIAIAILSIFLFLPVCIGLLRYFWRLYCGQNDNVIEIFYYLKSKESYLKVTGFSLAFVLRAVLCFVIFSIPVYVLKLITGTWLYSVLNVSIPIWTTNLSNIIVFLRIISITATLIYTLKFYLAPMLFIADENNDIGEALHLSAVICRRTFLDYVFLIFSFFGYFLLSLLTVPLIFILPYIIVSYLIHCSIAVEDFNDEIAKINQDDIPTFIAGV